jgi:hypothetical protein
MRTTKTRLIELLKGSSGRNRLQEAFTLIYAVSFERDCVICRYAYRDSQASNRRTQRLASPFRH